MSGSGLRLGCTGHQGLTDATASLVLADLRPLITSTDVVGVCSLAEGADQLFAQAVLDAGGSLEVIIPCARYTDTFKDPADLHRYEYLKGHATHVKTLPYQAPSEEAFWAAGQAVVDASDELLAVWDGTPAKGLGGTGDVVRYARELGRNVRRIWPPGATRL